MQIRLLVAWGGGPEYLFGRRKVDNGNYGVIAGRGEEWPGKPKRFESARSVG